MKINILLVVYIIYINQLLKKNLKSNRQHIKLSEKKINDIKSAKKMTQDSAHLLLEQSIFKSYFTSIVKDKYDDIEKLIDSTKIKDKNIDGNNFMYISIKSKISKKSDIKLNKKPENAQVSGMPIMVVLVENDFSASFETVSQKLEIATEKGSIVWNKVPIKITIGLSLDPSKQDLVTEINDVDFKLEKPKYIQPSLKEKQEIKKSLVKLGEDIGEVLKEKITDYITNVLTPDIESLVSKLNTDTINLGQFGSVEIQPTTAKMREDGKIDIEYSIKPKGNSYNNVKMQDPFKL